MLPTDFLGIAAAFVFLASLNLLALLRARLHWLAKAALTLGTLAAVVVGYASWTATQGWPVGEPVPEGATMLSGVVREPRGAEPGGIWLWLLPEGASQPRGYRLPYTRADHRAVEEAKAAAQKGMPRQTRRRQKDGQGSGQGDGQGAQRQGRGGQREGQGGQRQGQTNGQRQGRGGGASMGEGDGDLEFVAPPDTTPPKDH